MTETARKRRSTPKRSKPNRTSTSATAAQSQAGGGEANGAYLETAVSDVEAAVSDALADAVRLGYHVLAQNLEQGRAAAKQFKVGEYSVRDVPADLSQLTQRMMRLGRDLSLTTFDLLDRVMQDPAILTAARRLLAEAAPGSPRDKAVASPNPAKAAAAAASPPSPMVPLTCTYPSGVKATTLTAWLVRPPSPTTLTTAGLTTLAAGAPAIGGITFKASDDGFGVVADVPIAKGQPAGLYSGAVVSAESGVALGALTIQVGA